MGKITSDCTFAYFSVPRDFLAQETLIHILLTYKIHLKEQAFQLLVDKLKLNCTLASAPSPGTLLHHGWVLKSQTCKISMGNKVCLLFGVRMDSSCTLATFNGNYYVCLCCGSKLKSNCSFAFPLTLVTLVHHQQVSTVRAIFNVTYVLFTF